MNVAQKGFGSMMHLDAPGDMDELCPLSASQHSIWVGHQLHPELDGASNPALCIRVFGQLDEGQLREAVNLLAARHPMLRARIIEIDGEPKQQILSCVSVPVETIDARHLGEALLRQRVVADYWRPFDLSVAPLVRASLYRLPNDECVLLLVFDHIVGDGWSFWHLIEELDVILRGDAASLPVDPGDGGSTYLSYVREQGGWLRGARGQKELAYWRAALHEAYPTVSFPEAKPAVQDRFGKRKANHFVLGPELTRNLGKLAQKHNATLYMVLLAGYFVLLHRLTGEDRISIGSPMPGRIDRRWRAVIGDFANLVCLRLAFEPDLTVADMLGKVRSVAMRAMANQTYPFAELVKQLAPRREHDRHPYFQTLFVFQNARGAGELAHLMANDGAGKTISWGGRRVAQFWRESNVGAEYFDLGLEMIELAGVIFGGFSHAVEALDADAIERYTGYFRQILESMAADDAAIVDRLPLLDPATRQRVIAMSAAEAVEPPPDLCIHELFEDQAARTPDAVAVVFENEKLTYGELNARANRLANHLRTLAVGPEVLVGLCVERSAETIIGVLAILKAGGAYLPLDPAYPKNRLGMTIEDSRVAVLLTQEKLLSSLPETGVRTLCLDRDVTCWAAQDDGDLPLLGGPGNLAYVIYTSGSTGQPKGVMVAHANVVSLLASTQAAYGFRATDVWTLFHSYAFDFSVWEMWGALLHGGRLVVVPYWVSRSPEAFHELLATHGVTVLNQTPSSFSQLDAVDATYGAARPLSSLRLVIFGGEALDPRGLERWLARHGDRNPRLVNMYGITETTVHVTLCDQGFGGSDGPHLSDQPSRRQAGGIGRPLPGARTYVLDAQLQPVPIGVAGELYVGGWGVSRGYLDRPGLTAERFIPNPFGGGGERLYRTGDLVRWRADASLDYLGRIDHQVKIRGFRIELGEIEATLCRHPGVREAVVLAREDQPGDKRLVAYVVGNTSAELVVSDIRAALKRELPDYMAPSAVVVLDRLPLTVNGKVDRRALPAPRQEVQARAESTHEPPANELEATVAEIWAQLLRRKRIGRGDDFFDLGGHSLSAAILASRIREVLKREVSVATVFSAPTLAEFAACVASAPPERPPGAGAPTVGSGDVAADEHRDPHIISYKKKPTPGLGASPTIFAVGNASIFRPLAIRLEEAGQPFRIVRPLESEVPEVTACRTLEDIAAFYLGLLRRAEPDVPYVIFGFCATAALAFEMARQLGEDAALVIIVDAWAPGHVAKIGRTRVFLAHVSYRLRRRLWLSSRLAAASFSERLSLLLRIVPFYGLARRLTARRETHLEHAAELEHMNKHLVEVSQRYHPPGHKQAVLVIRGETQPQGRGLSPTLGWGDFATGPIDAVTTRGDHEEMFTAANVEALARAILAHARLRGHTTPLAPAAE